MRALTGHRAERAPLGVIATLVLVLLAVAVGTAIGGAVGFVLRPANMLTGQLDFETVISRGEHLQGFDRILVPQAQASFQTLVAGAAVGGTVTLLLGVVLVLATRSRGVPVRAGAPARSKGKRKRLKERTSARDATLSPSAESAETDPAHEVAAHASQANPSRAWLVGGAATLIASAWIWSQRGGSSPHVSTASRSESGVAVTGVPRELFDDGRGDFASNRTHDLGELVPAETELLVWYAAGTPGGMCPGGTTEIAVSADGSAWRSAGSRVDAGRIGRSDTIHLLRLRPHIPFRRVRVSSALCYVDYSGASVGLTEDTVRARVRSDREWE